MTPKEKKSIQQKEYYRLNKEKINAKNKIWRDNNPEYHKKYYEINIDKFNEYDNSENKKKYNQLNKQKRRETSDKWRKDNKEAVKEYYKKNKEELKKKRREYYIKTKSNVLFRLKDNIKSAIRLSFKSSGLSKPQKTVIILGCTFQEFKKYIENKFESWMNWDNYGAYKLEGMRTWNIDHIIPLASAKTEKDIIRLNHHTNLRPLCSKENLDKRDIF